MVEPPETFSLAPLLMIKLLGVVNAILPPFVSDSAMVTLASFSKGTVSIKPFAPLRASIKTFCLNNGPPRKMGLSANSPEKSSGLNWLRDIGAVASTPETSISAWLPRNMPLASVVISE